METSESDIGYPEEQPPEVDDTPTDGKRQRQGGKADERDKARNNDDGKATGNPNSAG